MPWSERLVAVPMARVGLVAPDGRLRRALVETADAGVFEPDPVTGDGDGGRASDDRSAGTGDVTAEGEVRLSEGCRPDAELEAEGRLDLLRGEQELRRLSGAAHRTGSCAVLTGWVPRHDLDDLRARLAPHGAAVAELTPRRGITPPTTHPDRSTTAALRPLVSIYATVPYRDLDPTWFAALAYVAMFGMMFGDAGHGAALAAVGLAGLARPVGRLARLRPVAPFLLGAGVASVVFGLLYGEAFGPTGLVPTLWLQPLEEPATLLAAGLVGGSGLLAVTFVLAAVNRWREGGPSLALYASSGIGGALLFVGAAALIGSWLAPSTWLRSAGVAVTAAALVLTFAGLVVEAGRGGAAIAQAAVELFDTVLRLGSNVVSFTRLAAFGLTHAVITGVVWDGTVGLWNRSTPLGVVAAVTLFALGNLVAFGLGALVGAIQALRLEYYELFSRLFATEGRPFRPWHPPVERAEPT